MKKTIKSLLAIAVAAFAFTACSDVPTPEGYNPNLETMYLSSPQVLAPRKTHTPQLTLLTMPSLWASRNLPNFCIYQR